MGNNCCKKQFGKDQNVYSTKALMNMKNFNGMDIYFSTQNLSRLEGDCLVVFSDHKLKMKKSNLSEIITQKQNRKIKQFLQAYLQDNQLSFRRSSAYEIKQLRNSKIQKISRPQLDNNQSQQTQFLLINIDIPTIKFRKLMVVFVQPWLGKSSIKKIIQERLTKALQQIQKRGIKQLALVQFDDQLGIPTNIGAAVIARSICTLSRSFTIATICCRGISNQLSYLSFFQNFKQDTTLTSYTKQSVKDSNYY